MAKSEVVGVLLVIVCVIGCGGRRQDDTASDSALNRDIGLARLDTVAAVHSDTVAAVHRDTTGRPPVMARPVLRAQAREMRLPPPPPPRAVIDTIHIAATDSGAPALTIERDTIGLRGPALPASLTRRDSIAIENQIKNLRAASIQFQAPDTLFISKPEQVRIIIDPRLAPAQTGRARIRPTTTLVSSQTEVCLSASGLKVDDEEGADRHCRIQPVPFTVASQWNWTVTALPEIKTSGPRPIDITVNAVLDSFPKFTVYTTHHTAYVHVDGPGILERTQEFLTTWQALLAAIVAIGGVLAKPWNWLKSRGKSS